MKLRGSINRNEIKYIQEFLFRLVKEGIVGSGMYAGVMLPRGFDLECSKEDILFMIASLQEIVDQGKPD